MKVAFLLSGSARTWTGGSNYFRNLFESLRLAEPQRIVPVVVTGHGRRPKEAESAGSHGKTIRTRWAQTETVHWKVRRAVQLGLQRDLILERLLDAHDVRLLSHAGPLGRRSRIPTLTWIPDFQERYFPEFFSRQEIDLRTLAHRRAIDESSGILLSSEHAREGLAAISPEAAAAAYVLPFVASVPSPSTLPSRSALEAKYGFSGHYYFLPNQLWVHKNHMAVIEALAHLKRRSRLVTVLATGSLHDYRQPQHGARVLDLIASSDLAQEFRMLGLVPYSDLMGLMAHSVGVLNPSLFEGWSTTVEEAKSFGKLALVSDIAVHREQAPPRALYFDPRSPQALADAMVHGLETFSDTEDQRRMAQAESAMQERRREFCARYAAIAEAVVNRAPTGTA